MDPTVVAGLVGTAVLYLAGLRRAPGPDPVGRARRWSFLIGLAAVALALAPGLERAAERSLSAHMAQHQLLSLVAAPLLAGGRGLTVARAVSGRRLVPSAGPQSRALAAVAAAALHLGVMLVWHVPAAYDAALRSPALHHVEHLSMLGTAVLAWAAIRCAADDTNAIFGAVTGLALLAVGGAVLGVVLLVAPEPLYAWYGTGAVDDQRVAGALMKVGALLVYAGAAVALLARWFQRLAAEPVVARGVARSTAAGSRPSGAATSSLDDRGRQDPTR